MGGGSSTSAKQGNSSSSGGGGGGGGGGGNHGSGKDSSGSKERRGSGSKGSSSSHSKRHEEKHIATTYTKTINDKAPLIRLDKSRVMKTQPIQGERLNYNLKWCYASQRGYYPNASDKANQDSYVVCERVCESENCHFFGIFDGHGEYGDYCSYFAADKVFNHHFDHLSIYSLS